MIASIMLYGTATAVLFALAALATERGLAALRLPRRGAWVVAMLASCVFPIAMLLGTAEPQAVADHAAAFTTAASGSARVAGTFEPVPFASITIAANRAMKMPAVNSGLTAAWTLGSIALGLFYAAGWLSARRVVDRWKTATVGGQQVSIGSDDVGPAVLGFRRPRIIIPQWLLDMSESFQRIVIQHEHQHVRARDQLSLLIGLAVVVIAPWNLPLWWQLRRLRFAIEVDCDARVLRQGVDPLTYGEVLLQVGRRHVTGLAAAVALIEPPSDLERRIRVLVGERKRSVVVGMGCLLLCASLVVVAAQLDPPQLQKEKITLLSPQSRVRARVQEALEADQPALFNGRLTQPVLVQMILDADLEIEWVENVGLDAATALEAVERHSNELNQRFRPEEPRVNGSLRLQRLSAANEPRSAPIYVAYAVRTNSDGVIDGERTKATERALIERHFPQIADGSANPHELLWIVLDRQGHVVNAGSDALRPETLMVKLNALHAGASEGVRNTLQLSNLFDRDMRDTQGEPLLATLVWLDELRVETRSVQLDARIYKNGQLLDTLAMTLQTGKPQRYQGSQLRADITMRNGLNDTVILEVTLQTPTDAQGAEFAENWETVARPRVAVKLDQQGAFEVGVLDPGGTVPVQWRIEVLPRQG